MGSVKKFVQAVCQTIVVVTLTFKILSGLYLRNCKVQEVEIWEGHWLGV